MLPLGNVFHFASRLISHLPLGDLTIFPVGNFAILPLGKLPMWTFSQVDVFQFCQKAFYPFHHWAIVYFAIRQLFPIAFRQFPTLPLGHFSHFEYFPILPVGIFHILTLGTSSILAIFPGSSLYCRWMRSAHPAMFRVTHHGNSLAPQLAKNNPEQRKSA